MLTLKIQTLFWSLMAILSLMSIIYCYQGLDEPWSEHHFNDSYSINHNLFSEFKTINGTTTSNTWIAGYDILFVGILYVWGLSTVSVSGLMVGVYFCRERKECHPANASSLGFFFLWLSLMLWLPIHQNLDSNLTVTWYRLIISTSINLPVHMIWLYVYYCRKHRPDTYVELPATRV